MGRREQDARAAGTPRGARAAGRSESCAGRTGRTQRRGIGIAAAAPTYIRIDPPAPRHEHFDDRPGYVVVPGAWQWRNGRHEWVEGHYVAERKGYSYERDRWVMHDNNKWTMQRGGWSRNHDSDGDGVPDRLDNYPNNPRGAVSGRSL